MECSLKEALVPNTIPQHSSGLDDCWCMVSKCLFRLLRLSVVYRHCGQGNNFRPATTVFCKSTRLDPEGGKRCTTSVGKGRLEWKVSRSPNDEEGALAAAIVIEA